MNLKYLKNRQKDIFDIENLAIIPIIKEKTGVLVCPINDANAGALAEKLYRNEKQSDNFAYSHIMSGD